MARKNEAEQLLRQGLCPSEIAGRMGISVKSVIQYLRTQVGEGSLRLSDLYFSWSPTKREILQNASFGEYTDRLLTANGLCRDELYLFLSVSGPYVFVGDLYEYVSMAEVGIHRLVRVRLEHEFGPDENGWWRKGIPSSIRVKCVSRREEDDDPCEEPYAYTTLIDLGGVISKNWGLFEAEVPKDYRANRKQLESDLVRLNKIRNSVMHPVKERKWSEDDFVFARRMCASFGTAGAS
jgi:hypothetical protein